MSVLIINKLITCLKRMHMPRPTLDLNKDDPASEMKHDPITNKLLTVYL